MIKLALVIGGVCLFITYILVSIVIVSTGLSPQIVSLLKFNIVVFGISGFFLVFILGFVYFSE